MEPLTVVKVNTSNNQDDAFDSGMTREDFESACLALKRKSRNLLTQLYKTLTAHIVLHRTFKLTEEDDEAVFRFNECLEHINCLLIKNHLTTTDHF